MDASVRKVNHTATNSTGTALLKVLNDLLCSVDNGGAVFLALLHQSAVFETIDHIVSSMIACGPFRNQSA